MKSTLTNTICVFTVLFSFASAFAVDAPNKDKEKKMFKSYKTNAEQPTDERVWWGVQAQSKAQTYKVQKGDTLSEVSDTLFGDMNFWPKVWSLNASQIYNPHEIETGMTITFVPGTLNEPPTLNLKKDATGAPRLADDQVSEEVLALTWNFEIPAPKKQFLPVENNLPESMPSWGMVTSKEQKSILELQKPPRDNSKATMVLPYFIAASKPEVIGKVVGTEIGSDTAAEYQYIYVKLNSEVKGSVVAFRAEEEVKDRRARRKGLLVEVQGKIEIKEEVNAAGRIYRALVKKSVGQIAVGSELASGIWSEYTAGSSAKGEPISGRVVGGSFVADRSLYGENSIVFISVDEPDSVVEGQILPIYKSNTSIGASELKDEAPRRIASAKVLKKDGAFVTAVINKQTSEVRTGDVTGTNIK